MVAFTSQEETASWCCRFHQTFLGIIARRRTRSKLSFALGLVLSTLCFLSFFYNMATTLATFSDDDKNRRRALDAPLSYPYIPQRPFPRWGESLQEENTNGIDFPSILEFILNSSTAAYAPMWPDHSPLYIPTSDHSTDVNFWFPETVYVLDDRGIWTSRLHRNITDTGNGSVKDKNIPAEEHMAVIAWRILTDDKQEPNYSRLRQVLKTGGFPFLAWYGDFTGCNRGNWKNGSLSIPLFTTAAAVDCNFAFPFPNYRTIRDSKESSNQWVESMKKSQQRYPWSSKKRQVVWRGSLTGKMHNATHKSPRWNMVRRLHNDSTSYFDVKTTRLPNRHSMWQEELHEVGGIVEPIAMEEFQKYRGILDIDGNSWSARFGKLLCYNSVVLKVDPSYVDYFQFKADSGGNPELQPWKHYIPVKSDLSNIVEMARYVADPANDEQLQSIVGNSNAWCLRNMIQDSVAHDMLEIWERYVELLDIANPKWSEEHWKAAKQQIFAPDSPLDMMRITE